VIGVVRGEASRLLTRGLCGWEWFALHCDHWSTGERWSSRTI